MKLEDFKNVPVFDKRKRHLEYLLGMADPTGIALEFGVWKGTSLRRIDEVWEGHIFGFDSFEGLPEDWETGSKDRPHPAGTFACKMPGGYSNRVKLIKGWFSDTLPKFLEEEPVKKYGKITFIHIDSDLYSSAIEILNMLDPYIHKDTIICFDELFNPPGGWYKEWKEGEWKALNEWLQNKNRVVKPLSKSDYQAGVIVC